MQLMKPKQLQKNKTKLATLIGSPLRHSVRKWAYSTNPEHLLIMARGASYYQDTKEDRS